MSLKLLQPLVSDDTTGYKDADSLVAPERFSCGGGLHWCEARFALGLTVLYTRTYCPLY